MADPEQRALRVEIDYRTLERLKEREQQRLAEAQLFAGLGSWDWDLIANRMTWSDQLYRLFGLEPQCQEGSLDAFLDLLDPAERADADRAVREARDTGQIFVFDHRVSVEDGGVRILESRGQVVLDAEGTPIRMVGTVQDVTDARNSLQALRAVERRFRTVIEESSDIVAILDAHGEIRYLSPSSTRILGIDPAVTTAEAGSRIHPDDLALLRGELSELRTTPGATRRFEFRVRDGCDDWVHLETVASNLLEDPDVVGIVLHCRDVTEQRHAETTLEYERLHDPLTGCPNRGLFAADLQRALSREGRFHRGVAVFAVDLDRFQSVNEHHGHDVGDAVLVVVAQRLESVLRAYDTVSRPGPVVSRLGGDEFFALCQDVGDNVAIAAIGKRLAEAVGAPLVVDELDIIIKATIGVAVNRGGDQDADRLLVQAETAMQRGKGNPDPKVELFDDDVREAVDRHDREVAALRDAIELGQLRLHYQPKVDIGSGQLRGVEALVRWEHPTRGLVPPLEFIALAEQNGLIKALGEWVLTEACRQQAAWGRALGDNAPPTVAVNVSGHQFVPGFVELVEQIVADTGVLPESVCIEITESVVMGDVEAAVQIVQELKALGLLVAIDDFGTGYSSLSHLKRFPIHEVKIDKSFVDGLGIDPEDTAIVAAIVAMAHALGLLVVAEGVETADQLQRLGILGCEMAQGYLFSRPVTAEDLAALGSVIRPSGDDGTGPSPAAATDVVLIADDTADVRQLATVSLSTSGFEVLEAANGDEALRAARRARPACVVLDVSMPGMDGFAVCRALRADPRTASAAILMLTSRAQAGDKVEAFSAGADDYIVKPFAPRELVSRIRQAIARRAFG